MIDSARAHRGAGESLLFVIHAGDSTAIFGGGDELLKYGRPNADGEMMNFPTDAIRVLPRCEGWYTEIESDAYVYVKGRLLSFNAGE
jgi:hypothetical protein